MIWEAQDYFEAKGTKESYLLKVTVHDRGSHTSKS
jgi:hypothetical protein